MKEAQIEEFRKKLTDDGFVKIIMYKLSAGERVVLAVTGKSMLPFLEEGRDSVILGKLQKRPKRGDIVLYRRKSGAYVLHRVVKRKDNIYWFSGDAQRKIEGPVSEDSLIAVCTGVLRGDKEYTKNSLFWLSYKRRFFKTKRKGENENGK